MDRSTSLAMIAVIDTMMFILTLLDHSSKLMASMVLHGNTLYNPAQAELAAKKILSKMRLW